MMYRGPGFLAVVWFGSSPTLFPFSPSASCHFFSVFLCVAGRAYRRERGEGSGRGAKSLCHLYITQYPLLDVIYIWTSDSGVFWSLARDVWTPVRSQICIICSHSHRGNVHCKQDPIYVLLFPEKKLRGLVPNGNICFEVLVQCLCSVGLSSFLFKSKYSITRT